VLSRQCGDPNVVGGQWPSGFLQLLPDRCIVRGSLLQYGKHIPECTATRQPCFIFAPATGGRDAEPVLSQHDHRNVKFVCSGYLLNNWGHATGKRRQRVGIENHCRSSGSIFSNSASMTRSIRRFSLWRCFSPPANTIHGFRRLLEPSMRAIFSDNASSTSCLSVRPFRASVAFAL